MLMDKELGHCLVQDRYVRCKGDTNHRNGSYPRKFTLKGLGEVDLKVPRDRNGRLFSTQVIPRSKQYEDALREDLSVMFLAGVSTRTLSMMAPPSYWTQTPLCRGNKQRKQGTDCCC